MYGPISHSSAFMPYARATRFPLISCLWREWRRAGGWGGYCGKWIQENIPRLPLAVRKTPEVLMISQRVHRPALPVHIHSTASPSRLLHFFPFPPSLSSSVLPGNSAWQEIWKRRTNSALLMVKRVLIMCLWPFLHTLLWVEITKNQWNLLLLGLFLQLFH